MLNALGNALIYAESLSMRCIPVLKNNSTFELDLIDIFDVKDANLIVDIKNIPSDFVYHCYDDAFPADVCDLKISYLYDAEIKRGRYVISNVLSLFGDRNYLELPLTSNDRQTSYTSGFKRVGSSDSLFIFPQGLAFSLQKLRLKREISDMSRARAVGLPERYIGVHFRNSDYKNDIHKIVNSIDLISRENSIFDCFWATDDFSSMGEAEKLLPHIKFIRGSNSIDFRSLNAGSLHTLHSSHLIQVGVSRFDLITDFFCDLFSLVKSTYFIRSEQTSIKDFIKILRSDKALFANFYNENQ